jgi:hypothetical protein
MATPNPTPLPRTGKSPDMGALVILGALIFGLLILGGWFAPTPPASSTPASSTLTTAPTRTTTSCGWVGVGVTVLRGGRAPEQDREYRCTTVTQ